MSNICRWFAILILFGSIAASLNAADASAGSLPNIVFIFADDMGYGDISLLNEKSKISTPNIDKLGQQGIYFTDAHAACSLCGPSRYSVLTGRYSMRNVRKASNTPGAGFGARVIEPNRLTVANVLQQNGYYTAAIGKWHLGMDWPTTDGKPITQADNPQTWSRIDYKRPITNGPNSVGFDYFFGIAASLDMIPYVFIENTFVTEIPTTIKQNDPPRPGPAGESFEPISVLPALTQKAVELIHEHRPGAKRAGQPFFIYMPLNAPHTPIVPTEEFQGKSPVVGAYGDFCMQVDDTVGQVIAALEKNGLTQNTLVIFTADNGFAPYLKPQWYEERGHFPSYVYRGYKTDIYEGGHRVPFLASWPAKIKPGSISNDTICLTDFFATCAEITNSHIPDTAAEDSISFLPILLGQESKNKRVDTVHLSPKNFVSIRSEEWKLVVPANSGSKPNWPVVPNCELYNVKTDPSETADVAAEHKEIVSRMRTRLQQIVDDGRSTPGEPQKNDSNFRLFMSGERLTQGE